MTDQATTEMSIADMVRQAASEVFHSRVPEGFEWIEAYGQYYSKDCGFYYDPSTGLFYDSNSETYFVFDDTTQSYEVYRCMQKVEWSCRRFENRARRRFGDDFHKINQDSADIIQTIFSLIDDVADNKLEHTPASLQKEEHVSKAKKRRNRRVRTRDRHTHKRSLIETEDPNLVVYAEAGSKEDASSAGSPSMSDEYWTDDETENCSLNEDERVQMMQDEGYSQPPLLRIIDDKNGLSVVTICGGMVGSGSRSDVLLSDLSLPEKILELCFVEESNSFVIKRLAKKGNVTLNDYQLERDDDKELEHGDVVRVGNSVLYIHVHYGNNTCASCEPGLLQSNVVVSTVPKYVSGETARRKTLKMLKASYGVSDHVSESLASTGLNRAARRRREVGSERVIQQPQRPARAGDIHANCAAKPLPGVCLPAPAVSTASVSTSIGGDNKGFKLLKGMGWKEGEGLGKEAQGRVEPVVNPVKSNRSGLGAADNGEKRVHKPCSQKEAILDVTRKRYEQISSNDSK